MKWTCTLLSLLLAAHAVVGQQSQVISRNAVGLVKVTIPPVGGYNLIAVGFASAAGGHLTLLDVFGTNQLIKSDVFQDTDKIHLWTPERQALVVYAQKPSGQFYRQADWSSGSPTNPVIPGGRAMWLQSPAAAVAARTICIVGQVVTSNVATNTMLTGYQCIGSSFSSEIVLTNNNWLADGATGSNIKAKADQIMVWNGADYDRYGLATDGRWYNLTNWITSGGTPVERILVPGQGGWYLSRAGAVWTWNETKPYTWP